MSTNLSERSGGQATGSGAERQIVALHLGEEAYGIDIAAIHSILTPQPITVMPNVPACVRGVMNLRGKIMPVLDLRTRFGLPPLTADAQKSARIVVVESEGLTAGLVVDSVSEVLRLPESAIDPPSPLLASHDLRCLTGIGRVPGNRRRDSGKDETEHLILLLHIPQVLAPAGTGSFGHADRDQ
jgi:purine-binding chemotaxis protein CheW